MVISDFDLIPDDINWKDSGCELSASCLNCPREKCIEEEPRGRQRIRMSSRSREMESMRQRGKSNADIASFFQVSVRTVQRALAAADKEREKP
jgi:DNA-binding NarL/FixJ family response regulator